MDKKYIVIIAILIIVCGIFVSLIIYGRLRASREEEVHIITPVPVDQEIESVANCDAFPNMLTSCTKYKCQFIHQLTEETMEREILGIIDGQCNYVEQMPDGGKMECKYTESLRKIIAQYYKDIAVAESFESETNIDLGSDEQKTTYTIDGKVVKNPLQEAINNGSCIIIGY